MVKLNTSIKPLVVALTTAFVFGSLPGYAAPGDGTGDGSGSDSGGDPVENPYVETNAKRIKPGYPLGTMADWLAAPDQYALNPINIRAGKHPDRSDPEGGPYDVVYIFPDENTANAWWNGVGTPPDEIPDDAVAYIHWMLDNESGSFPGIMSHSDIDGFKSRNCIMAAGDTIPQPGVKDGIPKDCSNPQGSSKRFKMNVLKPNVPIDLVYNVEQHDLTYTYYEDPPTHDGIPESGRIYRVLQKWHNATGTDTAGGAREGVRIGGFSLELGYGVGGAFQAIANANGTGLEPDKALGYELRPCMADHFFDVVRNTTVVGPNPCTDAVNNPDATDSTGQLLRQEIWLEEEYSTFSPKMYSYKDDKRTADINGGFWDKQPGGIEPPAIQTLGKLDSGDALSTDSVYDRIDPSGVASDNVPVFRGATTPNYLSLADNQAAGVIDPETGLVESINVNPQSAFGYLMYYGVLSDAGYGRFGDFGNLSQGIYMDDDGDPATEGALVAWWDGSDYRWGVDPTQDGSIDADKFTKVDRETLVRFAMYPLQEEPDPDTGEFPAGPLFELGVNDDLAGLNVDSFVYLGRQFDLAKSTNFTIRLRTVGVDQAPFAGTTGSDVPPWGTAVNPVSLAPALDTFVSNDGVVEIRAGYAGEPLQVSLADLLTALPTVTVENLRTEETESITLSQDPDLKWKFIAELPTVASGTPGSSGDGTLNVWPLDYVRVTYEDLTTEDGTPATRTDDAQIPLESLEPVPPSSDSDSGWCAYNPNGRNFDPVLPALVLIGLAYLGLRRKFSRK